MRVAERLSLSLLYWWLCPSLTYTVTLLVLGAKMRFPFFSSLLCYTPRHTVFLHSLINRFYLSYFNFHQLEGRHFNNNNNNIFIFRGWTRWAEAHLPWGPSRCTHLYDTKRNVINIQYLIINAVQNQNAATAYSFCSLVLQSRVKHNMSEILLTNNIRCWIKRHLFDLQ